jgi:hypothetical protein
MGSVGISRYLLKYLLFLPGLSRILLGMILGLNYEVSQKW